jgi:hypothetical protein
MPSTRLGEHKHPKRQSSMDGILGPPRRQVQHLSVFGTDSTSCPCGSKKTLLPGSSTRFAEAGPKVERRPIGYLHPTSTACVAGFVSGDDVNLSQNISVPEIIPCYATRHGSFFAYLRIPRAEVRFEGRRFPADQLIHPRDVSLQLPHPDSREGASTLVPLLIHWAEPGLDDRRFGLNWKQPRDVRTTAE